MFKQVGDKKEPYLRTIQEFLKSDPTNPVFTELAESYRRQTAPIPITKKVRKPATMEKKIVEDLVFNDKVSDPKLEPGIKSIVNKVQEIHASPYGKELLKEIPRLIKKAKPTEKQMATVDVLKAALNWSDETFGDMQLALIGKPLSEMNRAEVKDLIHYLKGEKVPPGQIPGMFPDEVPSTNVAPILPQPGSAELPQYPDEVLEDLFGAPGKGGGALLWKKITSPRRILAVDKTQNGRRLSLAASQASMEIRTLWSRHRSIARQAIEGRSNAELGQVGELLNTTLFPEEDLPREDFLKLPPEVVESVNMIRRGIYQSIANLPKPDGKPFIEEKRRIREYMNHVFTDKGKGKEYSTSVDALVPRGIPREFFYGSISKERLKNAPGYTLDPRVFLPPYIRGAIEKYVFDKYLPTFKEYIRGIEDPAIRKYAEAYIKNFMGEKRSSDEFLEAYFNLPNVKQFMQRFGMGSLAEASRPATRIANVLRSVQFMAKIGGINLVSPLKNATQISNTIAEVGPTHVWNALQLLKYPEVQDFAHELLVFTTPGEKFGVEADVVLRKTVSDIMGYLFQATEKGLRTTTLIAGISEKMGGTVPEILAAIREGAVPEIATLKGLWLVDETQFALGKVGKMELIRDSIMGTLLQFVSYSLYQFNFLGKLLGEAAQGKPRKLIRYLASILSFGTLNHLGYVGFTSLVAYLLGKEKPDLEVEDHVAGALGTSKELLMGAWPAGYKGYPAGPALESIIRASAIVGQTRFPTLAEILRIGSGFIDIPGRIGLLQWLRTAEDISSLGRRRRQEGSSYGGIDWGSL
jgi:hypothetical protein